jgi:hypothetical protein
VYIPVESYFIIYFILFFVQIFLHASFYFNHVFFIFIHVLFYFIFVLLPPPHSIIANSKLVLDVTHPYLLLAVTWKYIGCQLTKNIRN